MRKVSNMEGREFSEKMKKFLKEKKLSSNQRSVNTFQENIFQAKKD